VSRSETLPRASRPSGGAPRLNRALVRIGGIVSGVALVVAVAAAVWFLEHRDRGASASSTTVRSSAISWERPAVDSDGLVQRSGVRVVQVAVTGGGGLIDLRFQVVDPDKANAIHNAATPPAIVDERSGLVAHDLLMGHAHSAPFEAGVTYYLIFENPGNLVHRAAKVSVLLGDAQIEHIKVS